MCGSNGTKQDCCCCPNAVVLQEKVCGNLTGPLAGFPAWIAPAMNDYFQGTFEIFNAGPGTITAVILDAAGAIVGTLTVPPGNSVSVSVNNPNRFEVTVPLGTHGKFCITLYKRLFA